MFGAYKTAYEWNSFPPSEDGIYAFLLQLQSAIQKSVAQKAEKLEDRRWMFEYDIQIAQKERKTHRCPSHETCL